MKTSDESKPLDDLIFENRNQSYGAYVLRKSYSKNVTEGILASILLVVLVLCYPQLCKLLGIKQAVEVPKIVSDKFIFLDSRPRILEERPKVKPQPAVAKKANQNLTLRVTTADVLQVEPVPDPPEVTTPGVAGIEPGMPVLNASLTGIDDVPVAPKEPAVVDFAEVMPEFPGGIKGMMTFVRKNLKYPRMAKQVGIEGKVFIQFVVNWEGKVVDVKVITGISQDCDKEAARVIGMFPDWKPGRQGSSPVSVRMVLPINYKLDN